jgi:hypothetical protein
VSSKLSWVSRILVVQVPALASSAGRGFHTVRHAQCSTDGPTDQNRQGARLLLLSPVDFRSCILGYLVSCPRNSMYFVAIKMGRQQGARSGAYLNRYVTDEQRGRRPIFIATLRAGASWPFFRVALSARMIQIWALVRALKNSQLTSGKIYVISGTGH